MTDGALRVESLRAAVLRALIRSVRPDAEFLPDASALLTGLTDGSRWSLAADGTVVGAGPNVIRTLRVDGADERHLILDAPADVAETVATRLATLAAPPALWRVVGAGLEPVAVPALPVAVARAGPALVVDPDPLPPPLRELAAALTAEGDVRLERDHSGWILAVRGLEVGRVVDGTDGAPIELALGVGRFDRDAHVEVSGRRPVVAGSLGGHLDAIRRVVGDVASRRRADGPPHPARTLRAERWLRERLLSEPALAGLDTGWRGRRLGSPVAPSALSDWSVAPVLGDDGELVVAAVGVHPDLVWSAAHAWLEASALGGAPRLLLAVPARDAIDPLHAWLAALRPELGARLVAVPDDWMDGTVGQTATGP
jgi:hypothetical protein